MSYQERVPGTVSENRPANQMSRRNFVKSVGGLFLIGAFGLETLTKPRSAEAERGREEIPPARGGRFERLLNQVGLPFNGGFQEPDNLLNPSKPKGWNLIGDVEYVFRGLRGDSSVISRVVNCPTGEGGKVSQEDDHLMNLRENVAYNLEYDATRRGGQLNNQPRAIVEFLDDQGNVFHTLRGDGIPQSPLGVRETFRVSFVAPVGTQKARLSLRAMDIACSSGTAEIEFWRASVRINWPR